METKTALVILVKMRKISVKKFTEGRLDIIMSKNSDILTKSL